MMISNRSFMLRLAFWSLARRRSRLLAALIGVTLGAVVLLGMLTLCYDLPRQFSQEFRAYGANLAISGLGSGRLSLEDLALARQLAPPDKLLGLTALRYESVRNRLRPYTAVGVDFDQIKKTSPFWRVTGQWPQEPGDLLVGADIALGTDLKEGAYATIDGRDDQQARYEKDFRIVGTLTTGGVEDGFIFMTLTDMETMTGTTGVADLAEASLGLDSERLKVLAAQIKANVPRLEARLVTRVTDSESNVLGKLTYLVYLVALIVLALTMICVATTMMTVVLERRKEIGLKKALGAENWRVRREFLAEGVLIGVLGGFLGALGGVVFARVVAENVFGRALTPHLYLIPVTMAAMAVVTVIACRAPVKKAVAVEPALVLKGE
ncbi:MAG: FtsX-like permease family protein [Deltaproteobacteria bacterium]|jgi:putative ABC transport system permease protein|nr:FtsX-like permease family protein [Deltaproteobacteria bacterium]